MKRPTQVFLTLLLALCARSSLFAAQHWICVQTPHFEMYTTNNEKQAERALQVFEQVRYFFLQNSGNQEASHLRVRIIAFSSEKDYKPYRFNSGAFAYYLQSRKRDYIVMQDIQPEHYQVAVHEYTHLIVQHLKLTLPTWLNEGMADVYSSLEPHGQQAMVGRPIAYHLVTLQQERLIPWDQFFTIDQHSSYYNEREKMSIFYAQSWVTVHMLSLSPMYRPGFGSFLTAVAAGKPTAEALRTVYGKTPAQVGVDVDRYFRQSSIQAALYNVSLKAADLQTQTTELSVMQTELALADLLASQDATKAEARRRLIQLAGDYPDNAAIETSLGYLAWEGGATADARQYFRQAIEHGSQDAQLIYSEAQLEHAAGTSPDAVGSLVQKVIVIDPLNTEARITLAQLDAERGDCPAALVAIAPVHSVKPDAAYRFFSVAAYCQAELHNRAEAVKLATRALTYATTEGDRNQVQQLLHSLKPAKESPLP